MELKFALLASKHSDVIIYILGIHIVQTVATVATCLPLVAHMQVELSYQ